MPNAPASDPLNAKRKMVEFCLASAHDKVAQGCEAEARAFLTVAAELDLDAVRQAFDESEGEFRALAARIIILFGMRGQQLGHACALLGRAATSLDPRREALIRTIFDHHQREFDAGAAPPPPDTGIYDVVAGAAGPQPRVLMIMAHHINANPMYVESDIFYHFSRTAEAAGVSARVFEADPLLYDSDKRFPYGEGLIAAARRSLEAEIERFRPDILLFEGNFIPTSRTLDAAWLQEMRRRHGCRVATILTDCYDSTPNLYATWADASDVLILFNRETTHPLRSRQPHKAFYACGIPFDERLFAASEEDKVDEMVLVGTNHRSRADLAGMIEAHGIPVAAHLHMRFADEAPTTEEYAEILRRARMTFNSGRVEAMRSLAIVTGRCFEAILSGATLLEEAGSGLDNYFLPFVHYVPFANVAQLVLFSHFLRRNDDYRRRIAEQALAWHRRHYRSDRFWAALLARMQACGAPGAATV